MNAKAKTLLSNILPALGGLFVTYLYNVVDGIFVGRGVGAGRGHYRRAVYEPDLGVFYAVQYRRRDRRLRAAGPGRCRGRESGVYACAVSKHRRLFNRQRDGHADEWEDRAAIAQCMADMIADETLGANESLGITNGRA